MYCDVSPDAEPRRDIVLGADPALVVVADALAAPPPPDVEVAAPLLRVVDELEVELEFAPASEAAVFTSLFLLILLDMLAGDALLSCAR